MISQQDLVARLQLDALGDDIHRHSGIIDEGQITCRGTNEPAQSFGGLYRCDFHFPGGRNSSGSRRAGGCQSLARPGRLRHQPK